MANRSVMRKRRLDHAEVTRRVSAAVLMQSLPQRMSSASPALVQVSGEEGVRGVSMRSPVQGKAAAAAAPLVRLPVRQRRVQKLTEDRDVQSTALPLQELASAATTLGFLGDTPTEVFASAGLLLTAAGVLIVEAVQSGSASSPSSISKATAPMEPVRILLNCNGKAVHAAPTPDPAPSRAVSKPQAPSPPTSTLSELANVVEAREWIKAWRSRQSENVQPDVESFTLSSSAISETLQEISLPQEPDAEARQQEVAAWIAAFRARSEAAASVSEPAPAVTVAPAAVEASTISASNNLKSPNPFAAFFSWLRSLWVAIINLFKQDSGSKPQTA